MNKEVLEEGKKTEVGRLKIRKIRKYNATSTFYSTVAVLNEILAGACAITAIYSFFEGVRGKYFFDSSVFTFGACLLSMMLGFMSGSMVPEIRDAASECLEKAALLESEILEGKNKRK